MDEVLEKPACLISVPEYIRHLSKELEIEDVQGLEGNELEIIALIRNCPFLYDKSYPDFKDASKKNETWESIAEVFKVSAQDLQERWRRMRESYAKYTNYNKKNDSSRIHFPYYDEMNFLLPFIVRRNVRSNGSTAIIHIKEESYTSASEQEITSTEYELNYEDLIKAVHQNPVLYNRRHEDAKNHVVKMKTWKRISKEIGIPVPECVNRWKLLRERYARERKFRNEHPGLKKWYLFDKLTFLGDHVASRKRYSHNRSQNKKSPQDFDLSFLQPLNAFEDSSSSYRIEEHTYSKKEGENEMNYVTIEELGPLDSLMNDDTEDDSPKNVKESLKDEDELFGLAISAELRQIPSGKKKRKLKADIYKLLYEYSDQ